MESASKRVKKSNADFIPREPEHQWELDIVKLIDTKPDHRSIHWYWSEGGQIEIPLFKWLFSKRKVHFLNANANDIKHRVVRMKIKPTICVMRYTDASQIDYKLLAEIKDGLFFSPKYKPAQVLMNHPQVIVLANCEPDQTRMSADRWKITRMD